MGNKVIVLPSGSLVSRISALAERYKVEHLVKDGNVVLNYDLAGVDSMSESYSDELFGVLALRYGAERVVGCVRLLNANRYVLANVARVIQKRSDERDALEGEQQD